MTELVGRWSMVDIYVVTILVALVKLGGLATILSIAVSLLFELFDRLGWMNRQDIMEP